VPLAAITNGDNSLNRTSRGRVEPMLIICALEAGGYVVAVGDQTHVSESFPWIFRCARQR